MGRRRQMVKFWLDMKHADQRWIADVVAELRKRRQLARTIREDIALVVTLRQGDLSMLDELFPFVRESTRTSASTQASDQFNAILHELNELKAQRGRALPEPAIRQPIAVSEVSASKASAETVAKNFLTSMKSLATGFFD